ncbi:TIGR03862 family flavoprotein [Curvibacter sp. CHRR-16]|uniref:TIGR03862 family flavoprotein n=1 Tax=Curvibacter sp. CHRR-16 TaxID=2835872 RepID=UPI001BD9C1A0|nr:TIGR03862 family flavoprotein [Curvibacter sp. CHRR-16]MBT0568735.1 TIGR03862 family flavoprotein [Curvibacter sp. CHRR-16]
MADVIEERAPVQVAVVGGGPAGLMAAQVLSQAGVAVQVFDAMPSVGRKFLLAGRGGLNLTHSEGADAFAGRYGARRQAIEALLAGFDNHAMRHWAQALGVETFVGTSGRVFPTDMKAAPLLRAWLHRLRHPQTDENPHAVPVQFHLRHRWQGWQGWQNAHGAGEQRGWQRLLFTHTEPGSTESRTVVVPAQATLLALGGGSWARLGSDGQWVSLLAQRGVAVAHLRPSNCGFDVAGGWSQHFVDKCAGQPFKSVAISLRDATGAEVWQRKGEFVATASGVEGSLVYACSAPLRDAIERDGSATFYLNLLPDWTPERVRQAVCHPRGSRSLSAHLKSRLPLDATKLTLLHECLPRDVLHNDAALAAALQAVPVRLAAARPLDEAISTAGGVLFEVLTSQLMLEDMPGVFCAGEMLDWEAPTGGYLLQACCASGVAAGQGILAYLRDAH